MDETNDNRVGEVRDIVADRLYLRRVNGGREWTVLSGGCRPATPAEVLSERNAARNRLTRSQPY